jgi:hypothetical protein
MWKSIPSLWRDSDVERQCSFSLLCIRFHKRSQLISNEPLGSMLVSPQEVQYCLLVIDVLIDVLVKRLQKHLSQAVQHLVEL